MRGRHLQCSAVLIIARDLAPPSASEEGKKPHHPAPPAPRMQKRCMPWTRILHACPSRLFTLLTGCVSREDPRRRPARSNLAASLRRPGGLATSPLSPAARRLLLLLPVRLGRLGALRHFEVAGLDGPDGSASIRPWTVTCAARMSAPSWPSFVRF
ncbi:hypothetical protein F5X68DRAFT_7724 [Plectosphaerella plurivora]|uniref:Uncharacterized protein n=1 Tax=Plectosphaerella plurivora TaxID=936078 RepID=A0A9P9ACD9_9PEZI|nr:hypothetical protein F5X68DRAFT_7724 [Plectosphaerella plurivora]